jgi:hypothetical protein
LFFDKRVSTSFSILARAKDPKTGLDSSFANQPISVRNSIFKFLQTGRLDSQLVLSVFGSMTVILPEILEFEKLKLIS